MIWIWTKRLVFLVLRFDLVLKGTDGFGDGEV